MNIILIGMRGSGKSTIGKLLAKKLDKQFYDMDSLLEKKVRMTLPEYVKQLGWESFRDKESEVAEEVSHLTNVIIATGGGVILREKNINALKTNGKFIFLKTSIIQMLNRIGDAKNRPSLTKRNTLEEELEEIWKQRKSLYEQTADITIETDDKTTDEITKEIIKQL